MITAEHECLPLTEMAARLERKLGESQVMKRAARSALYRRAWGDSVERFAAIQDYAGLRGVPFVDGRDLRATELETEPSEWAASDTVRLWVSTSGTTGKALILANSSRDLTIIAEQGGRGMYASGLRPRDRVVHCLNYCLWTGGVTDHMILEATGATVIPATSLSVLLAATFGGSRPS